MKIPRKALSRGFIGRRLPAGTSEHVQFRCSRMIREALQHRAQIDGISERQAWEQAALDWSEDVIGTYYIALQHASDVLNTLIAPRVPGSAFKAMA